MTANYIKYALALIAAIVTLRLVSLGLYPLYDTTEARYGEIARIMYETQNWLTPQFDYGVPFWGKPPMHTWVSAASFSLFGISEFSARLPHFIAGLLTLWLVYRQTKKIADKTTAITAVLILSSCLVFFVATGMVMTDSLLTLSVTLAMISFWRCFKHNDKFFYGHLFFAALAMGMLVKGPVAIVLVGIALFVWSIWQKSLVKALLCLPWVTGLLLLCVIAAPWYYFAEQSTPGFLNYFFVGEHFQRFVVAGWEGDMYGTAHDEPRGMIWLFWLIAALPWPYFAIKSAYKAVTEKHPENAERNRYLLCWMIAPLLLFTLAGNILIAYVLPGITAMAVLIALNVRLSKTLLISASASFLLLFGLMLGLVLNPAMKSSEVELLGRDSSKYTAYHLYYWQHRPFSARYYSKGQAQLLASEQALSDVIQRNKPFYLVVKRENFVAIEPMLRDSCQTTKTSRKRILLQCGL